MRTMLILSLVLPSLAYGQVDSLMLELQYYPLQPGDYWQYQEVASNSEPPFEKDTSFYSVEAIKDTTLSNGRDYQALRYIYPSHDTLWVYERLDSLTGRVFRYDTSWATDERIMDSLFAEPPDTVQSSPHMAFYPIPDGPYRAICLYIKADTLLGMATNIKYFGGGSIFETTHGLAEGLGLYNYSFQWDFGHTDVTLQYAVIDAKKYGTEIPTDVKGWPARAESFTLFQNYPNPFNPSTVISYQLSTRVLVVLNVYDVLGRKVETLIDRVQMAGVHSVTFNAPTLPSGVYFYRLQAGKHEDTRKLLLLK